MAVGHAAGTILFLQTIIRTKHHQREPSIKPPPNGQQIYHTSLSLSISILTFVSRSTQLQLTRDWVLMMRWNLTESWTRTTYMWLPGLIMTQHYSLPSWLELNTGQKFVINDDRLPGCLGFQLGANMTSCSSPDNLPPASQKFAYNLSDQCAPAINRYCRISPFIRQKFSFVGTTATPV